MGAFFMVKIRLLLIEDNRLLREGIAAMLNGHGDFEVVAISRSLRVLKTVMRCAS